MPFDNLGQSDRYNGHIVNGGNNNIGFAGQIVEITDESGVGLGYYRTIVRTQDAEAMSLEMQAGYSEKALMSFDGMFRPVSMDGEGGLPRYARCPTFSDCSGCSTVSPNTFIVTLEDTVATESGGLDINGIYNIPRVEECLWSGVAANGIPFKVAYTGTGWVLGVNGDESNEASGVVECTDSNNPIQFTWGASLPSGYTGGTYEAVGFNAITIYDLNPWQNPSGMPPWDKVPAERSDTSNIGHDLDIVARAGDDRNGTPVGGLGMYQAGVAQTSGIGEDAFDYRDDYRFMALKGPIIVHGWGYDCNGRPVPNLGDNETAAATGFFTPDGLDDNTFLEGHLRKPQTWPVGPIDLRWDRERCVWVSPGCGEAAAITQAVESGIAANCSGFATQDCACAVLDLFTSLVDILGDNGTLNASGLATVESGIASARDICVCPPSVVDCENCPGSDNEMPAEIDLTVANVTNVPYPSNTSYWDFTGSDIAAWINQTHRITLSCESVVGFPGAPVGFVSQIFTANNYQPGNSAGNPYDVEVSIWVAMQTGAQWRYTIYVNNVNEDTPPTATGIVAQTSQFDGVDNGADCLSADTADHTDAVIGNSPDYYLDTSAVDFTMNPVT